MPICSTFPENLSLEIKGSKTIAYTDSTENEAIHDAMVDLREVRKMKPVKTD